MNVLSLFDGMSCGQIALERAGISVSKYYAAELDKYAITVTQANYPETIQLGDVTAWREWDIDWASIDLLIGGSPCQGFSFAGKQLAFDDPRSKLFFVYVDILNHIRSVNPNVKFMLENVKMKKEFLDVISEQLGVEPVFINSALVSAQNRQRYYWANWKFGQPEDKGIVLADILESENNWSACVVGTSANRDVRATGEKAGCLTANYYKGVMAAGRPFIASKKMIGEKLDTKYQVNPAAIRGRYLVDGKRQDGKMLTAGLTQQMLEVKSDQKTNALTTVQKDNVITPMKPGRYPLQNIWDNNRVKEVREDDRGFRPNRGDYKKTGISEIGRVTKPTGQTDAITTSHAPKALRHVDDTGIYYRKLTPIECERLQTVPDNYTNHVSNTQRYKMLGNGWTVDVIAHIFESAYKNQTAI